MNDVVGRYKWVGTRPIRPDGVPKVTGKAMYAADYTMPGAIIGRILRSPHAHARIRSIDTSKAAALPGVKAVVTAKDLPDHKFEYVGPERVAVNFWHVTRNVMAREKVLYEGHAVAGRRRDRCRHGRRGALADQGRLRGAAARHRCRRGDERRRAAAVRGHDHARRRAGPDQAVQRLEKARISDRRPRCRLRSGRRGRRGGVQDRGGASGLYRAACVLRARRSRRTDRDLVVEPGPFRRPRADRQAAEQAGRRRALRPGRDRRRVRRQDRRLSGAGRGAAVAEIGPPGEDHDDPRRGVQGHRPDLGFVDVGQDGRHKGRQDHRRRGRLQVPGRRLPGLAGDERLPVLLRALRDRERPHGRL